MKPTSHLTLMRYFDGELSPEEAAEVERRLRSDPEAQRVAANFELLGDVVRDGAMTRAAAPDDLVDSVMARLDDEAPAAAPELQPVPRPLDTPRARVVPITSRSPAKVAALVGVSLALAAGAALVLRTAASPGPELVSHGPAASPSVAHAPNDPRELAASSAESAERAAPESSASASIETVDFGSSAGTIFLSGEEDGEETTPVVWVMDEPAPSPGRMEPL